MSEAAARFDTGRSTLHCFRPAAASRDELAGRCAGTLRLAPYHRSAMSLESCSASAFRTSGVTDDGTDSATPAFLLFISNDRALSPQQLRGAFPAPVQRVHIAGTADAGLEHMRIESPDVIVLDLSLRDQSGLD